jgi:hypothetical protein
MSAVEPSHQVINKRPWRGTVAARQFIHRHGKFQYTLTLDPSLEVRHNFGA